MATSPPLMDRLAKPNVAWARRDWTEMIRVPQGRGARTLTASRTARRCGRIGYRTGPVIDLNPVLSGFADAAAQVGLPGWPTRIDTERLPAPHAPKALRPGSGAVYIFALADHSTSDAGAGRVLKVGRVGPNSNARFQSQHYSPTAAGSTLAKSLIKYPALWPWLGIDSLTPENVRSWMLANLDRANLYVPAASADLIPHLEMYVRARLGSVFEGSA